MGPRCVEALCCVHVRFQKQSFIGDRREPTWLLAQHTDPFQLWNNLTRPNNRSVTYCRLSHILRLLQWAPSIQWLMHHLLVMAAGCGAATSWCVVAAVMADVAHWLSLWQVPYFLSKRPPDSFSCYWIISDAFIDIEMKWGPNLCVHLWKNS